MDVMQWDARVDWITATAPFALRKSVELDFAIAFEHAKAEVCPAEEVKRGTWMGYYGWRVPHVFWGRNEEGVCIRASSEAAEHTWRLLPHMGTRVTRLDLALDLWLDGDYDQFAQVAADDAEQARMKLPPQRRRKLRLQDGMGDGDTLYIGSRKSEQYGRLYDKWRESGSAFYKHAWRAEIEYHDAKASYYFRALQDAQEARQTIAKQVTAWFDSRGVALPLAAPGDAVIPPPPARGGEDVERSLDWLAGQVAPALERLLKYRSRSELDKILFPADNRQ